MKKLVLTKVVLQPYFTLVDGDTGVEITHPVVEVPAKNWPAYSGTTFPEQLKEWRAQVETDGPIALADVIATPVKAKPNRAARRAKTPKKIGVSW